MRTKKVLSIIMSMTITMTLVFSWTPAAFGTDAPVTTGSTITDDSQPKDDLTTGSSQQAPATGTQDTPTQSSDPDDKAQEQPIEGLSDQSQEQDGDQLDDQQQEQGGDKLDDQAQAQLSADANTAVKATPSIDLSTAGNDLSITGIKNLLYSGKDKTLSVVVKYKNTALVAGTDYTLTYKDSSGKTVTKLNSAGTYSAVITGTGKYSGTVEKKFEIYKDNAAVQYRSHVQTYGWQGWVQNAQTSGVTGQAKRLEAISIKLSTDKISGGITYRVHGQYYGWTQGWKSNGQIAGTTGQTRRMEAIQIKLTGNMATEYDVCYRVHVQTYGWSDWARNGETAGTTGLAKRVEAIQIKVVPKGIMMPYTTPSLNYVNGKAHGIDVSFAQGSINWAKVKASGKVDFAFIRGGFRGYGTGALVTDEWFATNMRGATGNGIPVGVYFFSQAINEAEGAAEADYVCNLCKQYNISLPIVIDSEAIGYDTGRADNLSKTQRTKVTKAFCERVRQRGYTPMIYASTSWLNNNLDMSNLQGYRVWCAQYYYTCQYKGVYDVWQYTSAGSISGISGNVDCNWYYKR